MWLSDPWAGVHVLVGAFSLRHLGVHLASKVKAALAAECVFRKRGEASVPLSLSPSLLLTSRCPEPSQGDRAARDMH